MPKSTLRGGSHRSAYIALIILTLIAGLLLRLVPLGLPFVMVKFGGSMLWAAMIYWIVAALSTSASATLTGVIATLITVAVEFFKLYHAHLLDAFRRTLAGALLLGRYFSWWDLVAYLAAIALVSLADRRLIRRAT